MPDATPEPLTHPADLLGRAMDTAGSPGCVGLDPVYASIPASVRDAASSEADAAERFCLGVLEAVLGVVGVVKPQSACFERYGAAGYAALERVIARARSLGFVVILDAKRGDIGVSAEHYAVGARGMGAHWITVSPYMGPSTIEPFLRAGLGVFALCRTSNPDSDRLQRLEAGGRTVAEGVGAMIAEMGADRLGTGSMSALGAVVGATKSGAEGAALRALMPAQFLLVPGVGAQGGTPDEVVPLCRPGARTPAATGVVVNASRSVLYPRDAGEPWQDGVRRAAESFAASLGVLFRGG